MFPLDGLRGLLGRQHDLCDVARSLKYAVLRLNTPVVGALHVTCSDESEREPAEALQQWFVQDLLPNHKPGLRCPYRTANMGARYELGSVRLAEDHFANAVPRHAFKTLLIKLNSHVAMGDVANAPYFGRMRRYDDVSVYCGALHALMDGIPTPSAAELSEAFLADGKDRLHMLSDPQIVEPRFRSLYAAMASCQIQARRALFDVLSHKPRTPTLYLIASCVTLNTLNRDAELLCGCHAIDCRSDTVADPEYIGMGDDPSLYRARFELGRLHVEDDVLHATV